jgi:hypothetical protein
MTRTAERGLRSQLLLVIIATYTVEARLTQQCLRVEVRGNAATDTVATPLCGQRNGASCATRN